MTSATEAGVPPAPASPKSRKSVTGTRRTVAVVFLLPALVLLGALVVYPIGYSIVRSFYNQSGDGFAGIDNYKALFTDDGIRTALKNNIIWVVFAPTIATALGLIFAVLTERVRWGTAFKLVVFMPMAISMLAAGIIFRLVYEQDPSQGAANAVAKSIHDTFVSSSVYPKARPNATASDLKPSGGGSFTTTGTVKAGTPALLPLVGIAPNKLPGSPENAKAASGSGVIGTVWLDFKLGGGGTKGKVDAGEKALKGVKVEAVKDGKVVASAKTGADGSFSLPQDADGSRLRLPGSNFAAPYGGIDWLGPTLVTPSIIASYVWMWAGFAMVLIAAGLAGVDRNLLEAARVDGANEWQVFRRITVPMLAPVLVVVLVTLMINVMKVFDLVYIIAPQPSQDEANVLALQLFLSSFGGGGNYGVGSAIGVILLLLVLPVMYVNIRRLRKERQR
jgi:ABC-type sugar transport system permease subunit